MPKNLQPTKVKDALAITRGAVELLAADGSDATAKSGGRFKMTLYTGEIVERYNWATERMERIVLDVAGFKPKRENNLPAMSDHWERVGTIDVMAASGSTITAQGRFLNDPELFEASARIQKILSEGHALQCSGRWVPMKVEQVSAGTKASVNGKTVEGPIQIWREFSMREGSFCDLGRDEMTEAELAASANRRDEEFTFELISTPEKQNMNHELLASLKKVFGADKAIELVASKKDAADLNAFVPEILAHVESLASDLTKARNDLTASTAKVTALETELATAKKAPVVLVAGADKNQPTEPPKDLNAMSEGPEKWKLEFAQEPHLKAQFESAEIYAHYRGKGGAKPTK